MKFIKNFEKYKAKEFSINYNTRYSSAVFKQTINMTMESFIKIKIAFDNEIKTGCPRRKEYCYDDVTSCVIKLNARELNFEFKKFDLTHGDYIIYLNITQTKLIQLILNDMGIYLKLKYDRNTCIKITDGEEYTKLQNTIEIYNI